MPSEAGTRHEPDARGKLAKPAAARSATVYTLITCDDRGTFTTTKSITASPLAESVSAILKPMDGSVSANTS